jgi:hypothetical protein
MENSPVTMLDTRRVREMGRVVPKRSEVNSSGIGLERTRRVPVRIFGLSLGVIQVLVVLLKNWKLAVAVKEWLPRVSVDGIEIQ